MGQDISIRGNTYIGAEAVDIPLASGTGYAWFYDLEDCTLNNAGQMLNGVKAKGADGTMYTGNIPSKSAATYHPSTADQTVAASQYLSGAQTIKAVTYSGLSASNIVAGATVKIGDADDDDCVVSVQGSVQVPVVTYDSTTHVLSIS